MNEPITFTPYEVVQLIMWICGAIISIATAATIIIKIIQKMKKPEQDQNERITTLENRMSKVEQHLDNDNQRLNESEKSMKLLMRSNLAIMKHLVNGGDIDTLTKTMNDIQEY